MQNNYFHRVLTIATLLYIFTTACNNDSATSNTSSQDTTGVAKTDMNQVRAEIVNRENEWAAAMNAHDLDALMGLYADDAVSMTDKSSMLVGKSAIRTYADNDLKSLPAGTTISFETMDIYGDGNVVTETGKTTYKNKEGKVYNTGKYISVWETRDGKYVCIREIYNNDKK